MSNMTDEERSALIAYYGQKLTRRDIVSQDPEWAAELGARIVELAREMTAPAKQSAFNNLPTTISRLA
jgi:hypothetical protein